MTSATGLRDRAGAGGASTSPTAPITNWRLFTVRVRGRRRRRSRAYFRRRGQHHVSWPNSWTSARRRKLRGPWAVFFLALVTLGIYYLVWYYKINRELRDAGGQEVSPGIAPSPSRWVHSSSCRRSSRSTARSDASAAQEAVGLPDPVLPWVGFLFFVLAYVFLPFELVYAQSNPQPPSAAHG